ncbi:MAG: hypothetical protein OdinLCB4_004400 [Candidatus Odinarchaeum yellowstonii]|uniref:Uncharacterized protein n=1 Tax=Odinarchaeota yellowstonii (strain LCB_4) TaxID=1841599 RepID=A0AAF0IAH2_ODILC|nr:MAG: hypothetical protein OdinLCB4_004400 [Candidatus Odinarchaeum yellowstonii]
MPLRLTYTLIPGADLRDKITCLKEKLKLNVRSEGEDGSLILRNENRTVRVDLQVVQNEDYTLSYNIIVILENRDDIKTVLACLGEPSETRVSKPTILDVCKIIVSNHQQNLDDLVKHIVVKFNLSEVEVKDYFKRIIALSNTGSLPETVSEAVKVIKKLSEI